MTKQEMPEWITAAFMIIVLGALFPIVLSAILQSILMGIIIGVVIAIVIIIIWWLMTKDEYNFY